MNYIQESYKTIYSGAECEIIVKKSRFISNIKQVESEEDAISFIEEMKRKYWDANHNCSAYIIGNRNSLMRCSDDGEPNKTAGRPMLDVLISHELNNLVVVVTRYFGGTLLGTGGLVKAYQAAVIEGINHSQIITKESAVHLSLTTEYYYSGKLQYYIAQENFPLLSSEYTEFVNFNVLVTPDKYDRFIKKVAEITNGSVNPKTIEHIYYALIDNTVYVFR